MNIHGTSERAMRQRFILMIGGTLAILLVVVLIVWWM